MYYYYKSVEVVLKNAILYLYLYTRNEEKNQVFTKNICYTVDKKQKKNILLFM